MSNPDKQQSREAPRAIPVYVLRFQQSTDLPKKPGASSVKQEFAFNKPRYTIEFLPWMRHHKITFFESGQEQPSGPAIYVHESRCTWEGFPDKLPPNEERARLEMEEYFEKKRAEQAEAAKKSA